MAFSTLLMIAVALSVDAFAVAVASGGHLRCLSAAQVARMAGAFGFFQFAMPVAGWFLGAGMEKFIHEYDHWVAFILLAFVGGRMLKEAWDNRGKPLDACDAETDPTTGASLFLLALATSIDALAVGLSIGVLGRPIWFPATVIGIICFGITAAGMYLGKTVCSLAGTWTNKATVLGGLVLIGIGLNILREHGVIG